MLLVSPALYLQWQIKMCLYWGHCLTDKNLGEEKHVIYEVTCSRMCTLFNGWVRRQKRSADMKKWTLHACTVVGAPRAGKILMLNIWILHIISHCHALFSSRIRLLKWKGSPRLNLLLWTSKTYTKCTVTNYTRVNSQPFYCQFSAKVIMIRR